ncbi:MAG: 30S ribosomal protein S2 [Balneolaceae bacterium]|nr:30S ribosomal protein S2 [Balneolaceae bacterium]
MSNVPDLQEMLKSGAHFGHLTRRWNPKMKEFIFMERNGIHIIDLKKTAHFFQEALDEVGKLARAGKTILFVGTKKQAQDIVRTEAIRCGMPFVTHRWLGGMLTNFSTVRKSISRMEEIDRMSEDGTFEELTKKEALMLDREREKLEQTLGGIANMNHIPGAIFVVDTIKEDIAVNEAVKLNIPIVAMVDTNSDPDIPDYIVPCNDDSARTIQLIASHVADAIIAGNAEREAHKEEELMEQAAEEARRAEESRQPDSSSGGRRRTRRKRVEKAASSPETDITPQDEEDEGDKKAAGLKAKDESGDTDAGESGDGAGEEE